MPMLPHLSLKWRNDGLNTQEKHSQQERTSAADDDDEDDANCLEVVH